MNIAVDIRVFAELNAAGHGLYNASGGHVCLVFCMYYKKGPLLGVMTFLSQLDLQPGSLSILPSI